MWYIHLYLIYVQNKSWKKKKRTKKKKENCIWLWWTTLVRAQETLVRISSHGRPCESTPHQGVEVVEAFLRPLQPTWVVGCGTSMRGWVVKALQPSRWVLGVSTTRPRRGRSIATSRSCKCNICKLVVEAGKGSSLVQLNWRISS